MARFDGTAGEDDIEGTGGDDVIFGLGGDDGIAGAGGNDRIDGGAGFDWIYGGEGADRIDGGADGDLLRGEGGNDRLEGGTGEDALRGGLGKDMLSGGDGDDDLQGDEGNDTMTGGLGNDAMRGGSGLDQYDGGEGNDAVSFFDVAAREGVMLDLRANRADNDGFGNVETLISVESVSGTVFADTLIGTKGANLFGGGAGDRIFGLGGDDVFLMSSIEGAKLNGGAGSDELSLLGRVPRVVNGKVVYDYADQGMVVNLALGKVLNDGFGGSATITGFENATTAGTNDSLIGNSGDNRLYTAGGGDDYLFGGAGDDVLSGGYGADTLRGGPGDDVFGFGIKGEFFGGAGDPGTDTIEDFSTGDKLDVRPNGDLLTFIGTAPFTNQAFAIRYEIQGSDTIVFVRDLNPAGYSEFSIKLLGVHELTAEDFVQLYTPPAAALGHEALPIVPASHLVDMGMIAIA